MLNRAKLFARLKRGGGRVWLKAPVCKTGVNTAWVQIQPSPFPKKGGKMARQKMEDWRRRGTMSLESTFVAASEEGDGETTSWLTAEEVVSGSGLAYMNPEQILIRRESGRMAD